MLGGIVAGSASAGEHARRAAAELLVLAGDIKRLAHDDYPANHQQGLRDRIAGGLAGLEIILRLADQEMGKPPRDYTHAVAGLRNLIAEKQFARAEAALTALATRHPLRLSTRFSDAPSRQQITLGQTLHDEYCAGCHDEPDLETQRPAYNLFKEVKWMGRDEFAARMIVGVRGDRMTGIGNPLSDTELSALIAFYTAGLRQ